MPLFIATALNCGQCSCILCLANLFCRWNLVGISLLFLVQVHNTFRDLEESNILQPYMMDAIKDIAKACQAFEVKESAPPIAGI